MYLHMEGYLHLLRRHRVGTLDYKDITDVLKAVNEIDRVHGHIVKAPNEEASTLEVAATERSSTSTAPTRHGYVQCVATPQVVPSPDPSPPTPHPSPSPDIPSPTSHPCLGFDIPPPTRLSFPQLSPIPSFDLGIDFNPTPPIMHTEPPSHTTSHIDHESFPPTSSTGPTSDIDPPHANHVQSEVKQLHMHVQSK